MSNKPTEYSVQELKNLSGDGNVSPPIPREAIMGKDTGGNWRVIKVNTDGKVVVNV